MQLFCERLCIDDPALATAAGEGGIEFSAERPCTVLDLRPEERTVALVPSPKG